MIRYMYAGEGLDGFVRRGSSYPREFHSKLFRDMLRYVQMELALGALPDGKPYISKETLLGLFTSTP